MKSWPKVKLGQVQVGSNIAQNHSSSPYRKSYLVIICPSSHEKLIKSEIWSLFAQIHMKSWPKVKLGLKLLLAPIWFYLVPLFGPKIPFWSIFSLTYLYLPLFIYIWLYLGLITLIWAYLPLIALIWSDVPYSPYICILLLKLHLCANL